MTLLLVISFYRLTILVLLIVVVIEPWRILILRISKGPRKPKSPPKLKPYMP